MFIIYPCHARRCLVATDFFHRWQSHSFDAKRKALWRIMAIIFICTDRNCHIIQFIGEYAHKRLERIVLVIYFPVAFVSPNDSRLTFMRLEDNLLNALDRDVLSRQTPSVLHLADIVSRLETPSFAFSTSTTMLTQGNIYFLVADHDLQADECVSIGAIVDRDHAHSW